VLGALPGLREIRSALAGGYLWIAFFWLALDPVLGRGDFTDSPYRSAHHLGNELGPVALSVGITFAAYLIGTFINEGREVAGRLYLRARQSAGASPAAWQRRELIDETERVASETRKALRDLFMGPENPTDSPEQDGSRPAEAKSRLVLRVQESLAILNRSIPLLVGLPMTLIRLPVALSMKLTEWTERLIFAGLRRLIAGRMQPYRPFLSEHGVQSAERYIAGKKRELPGRELEVADVIGDFPVVRTRLIHRSPDTVSEYDRLRAEADFRTAIVPPLMAIAGFFAWKVSHWWILSWPLLLTLLLTAQVRRREAGDILADVLGIVDAPSAEPRSSGETEQITLPIAGNASLAD
jgi:hypothetical protein